MRGREAVRLLWAPLALLLVLAVPCSALGSDYRGSVTVSGAPDSASAPGSGELRSALFERQREAKMALLEPIERNVLERGLLYFETSKFVDRLRYGYHGFFPQFGGLSTGSGFALGLRYQKAELIRNTSVFSSFRLSVENYQLYEAGLQSSPGGFIPLVFGLNVCYRNYPQEEFFGLGSDSSEKDETGYRIEDFNATLSVGTELVKGVELGLRGGFLRSRTGVGVDERPLEEVFESGSAPGFGRSIDYRILGAAASLDLRDSKGNPRSGIALFLQLTRHDDSDGDAFSFQASSAELQAYLPFFHKHRVIALRGIASEAKGVDGGVVPFYLRPHVGGGRSIRGFDEYRFRDGKSLLGNVEYRFEAFIGLDVALFGDFGQVGEEWSDFRTPEFKYSYGGGLRFNTAASVFMRLDLGYGKEGTRFFWKFENVF